MGTAPQPTTVAQARCVMCRVEVAVPASYAHGDQLKCGSCGTLHKVARGERVRLVLADVAGLREDVRSAEERVAHLEADLLQDRGSIGIGVNGFLMGLAYLLYQIGINERDWSTALLWTAAGLSLVAAALLELANFLFLAKRQRMTRISEDITAARTELRQLRQHLRDATRV